MITGRRLTCSGRPTDAQGTLHLALDGIGRRLDRTVIAGVIAGELRSAPLLVLLHMLEFMSPERNVVLRILRIVFVLWLFLKIRSIAS